jgi:hypothetical protein
MSTARPAVTVCTLMSERNGLAATLISAISATKLLGTIAWPVADDGLGRRHRLVVAVQFPVGQRPEERLAPVVAVE